eukprot:3295300-Amphidinium_carterae.1
MDRTLLMTAFLAQVSMKARHRVHRVVRCWICGSVGRADELHGCRIPTPPVPELLNCASTDPPLLVCAEPISGRSFL